MSAFQVGDPALTIIFNQEKMTGKEKKSPNRVLEQRRLHQVCITIRYFQSFILQTLLRNACQSMCFVSTVRLRPFTGKAVRWCAYPTNWYDLLVMRCYSSYSLKLRDLLGMKIRCFMQACAVPLYICSGTIPFGRIRT